jgi:hypothetical protein
VKDTREQQRVEARKAKAERRRQAVEWVADGEKSQAEIARLLGMAKRSIERWCASEDFGRDVERLRRERSQADEYNRDRKWKRHDPRGYRQAHDPAMRPEVAERRSAAPDALDVEMERARQRILARRAERQRQPQPAPAELSDRQAYELWLINNALRSGRITDADFNRRYDEIVYKQRAGRMPQVQVISIPRQAEYEYGPGNRAPADAFEGQYAR